MKKVVIGVAAACLLLSGASIGTDYAYDENGQRLYSYEEMDIEYKKEGEPSLSLVIEKPVESQYGDIVPEAVRTCEGITVQYWKEEFSVVDTDYVVTKKELEEMTAADTDISIEWNENTAKTSHHVMWEKDGVHYMFFGFDVTLSPDGMMDMAEEIIMSD